MTCKNCGKQITDRTKGVCPVCGETVSVAPEGNGFYDLVAEKNGQIVSAVSVGNGVPQEKYDRLQSEHLELKDAAKKLFLRLKILLAVSAVFLVFAIVATIGWIVSNGNRKALEDTVAKLEDELEDFEETKDSSEVSRSDESADTSSFDTSSSDIVLNDSSDTSSAEESFVIEICAEHDYQISITVAPSCAEEGVSTFTCSKCGESYEEPIAKTEEHEFSEGSETPATCSHTGELKKICTVCGLEETETVPRLEHAYGDGVVTQEATCEEDGILTKTCVNCGNTATDILPAKEHAMGESYIDEDGTERKKCENCDYFESVKSEPETQE